MKCPRCKVPMQLGKAIDSQVGLGNCRIFVDPKPNLINHKTLKLIDVLKCPKCGYSEDLEELSFE